MGLIMVAVKGGRGAGSRVEVVVLLAPLSVECGCGREDHGAGVVRGVVQLLPTRVLLLLPTRGGSGGQEQRRRGDLPRETQGRRGDSPGRCRGGMGAAAEGRGEAPRGGRSEGEGGGLQQARWCCSGGPRISK